MGWRVCSCGRNACKVSLTVDEKETDDIILTMKCIWHYRREKWLGHHDTGGKSERSTGTNLCDRPKGFSLLCMGGRAGKLVNLTTGKEYKTRFLVLQIQYENSIMESSFFWQPCFWSPISWIAAIPRLKMSNTIVFCCQNIINCHSIHFYPKRNEVENQSKISTNPILIKLQINVSFAQNIRPCPGKPQSVQNPFILTSPSVEINFSWNFFGFLLCQCCLPADAITHWVTVYEFLFAHTYYINISCKFSTRDKRFGIWSKVADT